MTCPVCNEPMPKGASLCQSVLCRALRACTQDDINAVNRKLDTSQGIVAGDGCYYPRYNPDGSDPFNP